MPEVYLEYFIALLYVYSTVQYLLAIFSYFRVQYTVMYIILGGHSFIFIIFFNTFSSLCVCTRTVHKIHGNIIDLNCMTLH